MSLLPENKPSGRSHHAVDLALARLQSTNGWVRKFTVLTMDVLLLCFAYLTAIYLRLGEIVISPAGWVVESLALLFLLAAIVVPISGLSRSIWRYASLPDFLIIARTTTVTLLLHIVILFLLTRNQDLPRSVPAITWFVSMIYLSFPRVTYRILKDKWFSGIQTAENKKSLSILLFGNADDAELYLRSSYREARSRYQVSGIFEINPAHVGKDILGVRVLGGIDDIKGFLERAADRNQTPRHIVITSSDMPHLMMRNLMKLSSKYGISLARLPDIGNLQGSNFIADYQKFKAIQLEDVLGRRSVNNNLDDIADMIHGQRVMITGAGGSIGSELTRQIASYGPSHLVMLDNNEFNLFEIEQDIAARYPRLATVAALRSIQNREQITRVILGENPDLIFHAAALKHVPLVEINPWQGVQINVCGTQNVADAAKLAHVKAFVMISTDKAVNPTNVMGVTKKIAEKYCQALDLNAEFEDGDNGHHTRFLTVRFGNVLGSAGSVVPFFEKQIAQGGPVTVTHPEIERFFMTIKEAVELVLQASSYGMKRENERGQIFVLEMGKPVKIMEIARQLIRLAGHVPDEDIKVRIVGLRPGEKLTEELFAADEPVVPTDLTGVLAARAKPVDIQILKNLLNTLGNAAQEGETEKLLALMKNIVPEYSPSPEFERLIQRQTSREIIEELLLQSENDTTGKAEDIGEPDA